MELTFEHEKELTTGAYPIITHLSDDTVVLIYEGGGGLKCRYADYIENDVNSIALGAEETISNDVTPKTITNARYSGGKNWLAWNSGSKQRSALLPESPYIMKPLFQKGFMLGAHSKEAEEYDQEETSIDPSILLKFGVDFYNGFVVGRLSYKQMYGGSL